MQFLGLINRERVPRNNCEIRHGLDGRGGAAAGGAAVDGSGGGGGVCKQGLVLFANRHGGPGASCACGSGPGECAAEGRTPARMNLLCPIQRRLAPWTEASHSLQRIARSS